MVCYGICYGIVSGVLLLSGSRLIHSTSGTAESEVRDDSDERKDKDRHF